MIRVLFICHGNICRSTLSESVFTYKVKELGLSDRFVIDSLCDKHRGDWKSSSQRHSKQIKRNRNSISAS